MSTNLIASLRKQLPSIYGEHLPDEIRYRRADGQDVVVPLDAATVEEIGNPTFEEAEQVDREVNKFIRTRPDIDD